MLGCEFLFTFVWYSQLEYEKHRYFAKKYLCFIIPNTEYYIIMRDI